MTSSPPLTNDLLARLPSDDYQRLLPSLATIPLERGFILHRAHEEARKVYFPVNGVCSIRHVMADGQIVETASIGREGMVGLAALFGGGVEPGESIVLVPDSRAQVMDVSLFYREVARRGTFSRLLNRYTQAFVAGLLQTVGCTALHPIERRCARWLLQTHDRVGCDDVALTQEVLADVLGVRRASVTLCAHELVRQGAIELAHKRIRILNRSILEAAACECYAAMRAHFVRLFA